MNQVGPADRRAVAGVAAVLVCILAVAASALDRPAALHAPTRDLPHIPGPPPGQKLQSHPVPTDPRPIHQVTHQSAAGLVLQYVLLALVIALVIALAVVVWRAWRDRGRLIHENDSFPEMGEIQDTVHEAVLAGLVELQVGRPDEAIVRCWIRLERAVSDAGVPLRQYETSSELVIRVFDKLDVPREPLVDLESLYREARYSTHSMSELARARARADLTAIAPSLDRAVST